MRRRDTWGWVGLIATLGLLSGCLVENPTAIRDTTGAELGWDCAAGSCAAVRESFSPLPPDCGEGTELLVGSGPIAILCAVSRASDGSDVVHAQTCRPLACFDDLSCPQWNERQYVCIAGICQVSEAGGWRLDEVDLTALCLYDVERHASCAEADADPVVQARLADVAAACASGTCESVPPGCLEP